MYVPVPNSQNSGINLVIVPAGEFAGDNNL